jgi:hypothetical protein
LACSGGVISFIAGMSEVSVTPSLLSIIVDSRPGAVCTMRYARPLSDSLPDDLAALGCGC